MLAFALRNGAKLLKAAAPTEYGGYAGYFADPDGHVWEAVVAPGIVVGDDRRVHLPDQRRGLINVTGMSAKGQKRKTSTRGEYFRF